MVIRPNPVNASRPRLGQWVAIVPAAALATTGLLRLALTGSSGVALDILLIGAGGFGLFIAVGVPAINELGRKNATVFLDEDHVGTANLFGRKQTFPRADLDRIVLRSVTSGPSTTACTLFVSKAGTCLFRVQSRQWSLHDLQGVANAAKVQMVGSWEEVSTPRKVNAEVPGTFSRLAGG